MKKIYFIPQVLISFFIFSCSPSDSTESDPNNPNIPEELSEYAIAPCDGFVEFKGSQLLSFLRSDGYDTDNDGKISCSEADKVEHLNFGYRAIIRSLNGIEYLGNLKTITGGIHLSSGSDDVYLTVSTLNLFNNKKLEEINFNEYVSGENTSVGTVVFPSSNSLKIIDFSKTSVLEEIKNIKSKSKLEYVNFLNSGRETRILDLSESPLLKEVNVGTELILGNHKYLTALQTSSAEGIDFSGLPNLEVLKTTSGNVINIDLSSNPKLHTIWLPSSNLAQIDLTNNKQLESLILDNNLISQLDLSENPALSKLSVKNNSLENLDISNSSNLEMLFLSDNNLESINLSSNIQLQVVYLSENLLKTLDFRSHSKISSIDVSNNKLTSLSLKNGNNYKLNWNSSTVKLDKNNLDCIEIDESFIDYGDWIKDTSTQYSSQCE